MRTALGLLLLSTAVSSVVSAQNCDCWETHNRDRFTSYRWLDFRHRSVPAYPPPPSTAPSPITNPAPESVQPGFLTTPEFADFFWVETWGRPGLSYSRGNVYIASNNDWEASSKLVLRSHKNNGWNTAGEISSIPKMKFGSFRVRARIVGDPGACAGIFTYQSDTQESDIEVLTKDPSNVIHYTNQPGTHKEYHFNRGVSWSNWHTHRIDWTNGLSRFFIDGMLVDTKTTDVPTETSSFMINMWGDDQVWTGNMGVGKEARLEILFIELLYNNTESAAKTCKKICYVDRS